MMRLLSVLAVANLAYAVVAPSLTHILFLNSTTELSSSSSTNSSTVFPSSSSSSSSSSIDPDLQDCTAFPIDYRTGFWWSRPLPTAIVGTVYTIIDDSTNSTTTSTQQLDQVTVTRCDPDCEVWTENRTAWSRNGTWDVGRPTTVSDSMRLLDGSYTTLAYPNGVFEVTDSFYWRGTVTYAEDDRTMTASNTGPPSAPGYRPWPTYHPDFWLPPSPLPDHDDWANTTVEVDPTDPYGHNYVLINNVDCNLDMDYMLRFFHDPAISAEWHSCKSPMTPCNAGMIWVSTVNYLLDSTTIRKGNKPGSVHGMAIQNEKSSNDQTVATKPLETKPNTAAQVENTLTTPTRTAAPGSTVPHKPPKETKKTETRHKPTSKNTRSPHGPEATETSRDNSNHTKTRPRQGEDDGNKSTRTTGKPRSHNTPLGDGQSSPAVISIGSERITRNPESEYVISGTTLAPGIKFTLGSGKSATTIATLTQGQHTVIVINGEKSTLGRAPLPTGSPEYIIGDKTLEAGSSVVVSGDTYSIAPGGSTVFVNGHPENIVHSTSLVVQTWVTPLSNGMLLTKTVAPEVEPGAITTSAQDDSDSKVTTEVTMMPALIFGSKTLSVGSHITISGTTYGLGSSILHVDGKSTTLNLGDDTMVVTFPNGMVATETEATFTLLLSPSSDATSGTSARVTEATSMASKFEASWSFVIMLATCMMAWIL